MSQRKVLLSEHLSSTAAVQLCQHLHYNYIYLNIIRKIGLEWNNIKLNLWEAEAIKNDAYIIEQNISDNENSIPVMLRSKL